MLPGNVSLRSKPGRMGDTVLGSWPRTLALAAALLVVFAVVAVLAITGRLGDLRYANVPLVHPYPPAGYYQNPFDPGDRGDLVNVAQANRVKSDLLVDGQTEIQAFESGDASLLGQADTGRSLTTVKELLQQNTARGQTMRVQNHVTSVVVGKLTDPNDASISWCVREKGSSSISYIDSASGRVVRQLSVTFDDKFWLAPVGGRYLIVDAEVSSNPAGGA
jgi:hypothetical protein